MEHYVHLNFMHHGSAISIGTIMAAVSESRRFFTHLSLLNREEKLSSVENVMSLEYRDFQHKMLSDMDDCVSVLTLAMQEYDASFKRRFTHLILITIDTSFAVDMSDPLNVTMERAIRRMILDHPTPEKNSWNPLIVLINNQVNRFELESKIHRSQMASDVSSFFQTFSFDIGAQPMDTTSEDDDPMDVVEILDPKESYVKNLTVLHIPSEFTAHTTVQVEKKRNIKSFDEYKHHRGLINSVRDEVMIKVVDNLRDMLWYNGVNTIAVVLTNDKGRKTSHDQGMYNLAIEHGLISLSTEEIESTLIPRSLRC